MKLAIASDHAGYGLKEQLKVLLEKWHYHFKDFGPENEEAVDYPDHAIPVVKAVKDGQYDRGILICGTGLGMSIVANRFRGIRATLCYSVEVARLSRAHNNSNILILPGRMKLSDKPEKILKTWLETAFEAGRHQRRLDKIEKTIAGATKMEA